MLLWTPPSNWPDVMVYEAVVWLPTVITLPLPSVVAPSLKVTVPVGGTPTKAGVIRAVNVTSVPNADGLLGEALTMAVVVAVGRITWLKLAEVLVWKFASAPGL